MPSSTDPARTETSSADTHKGRADTTPIRFGLNQVRLSRLEPIPTAARSPERLLNGLRPGETVELDCGRFGGRQFDEALIRVGLRHDADGYRYQVEPIRPLPEKLARNFAVDRIGPAGEEQSLCFGRNAVEALPGERLRLGEQAIVFPYPELSSEYENYAFGQGAGILSSADGGRFGPTLFGEFAASTRRRVSLPPEKIDEAYLSRKFDRTNQDGYLKLDGFCNVREPVLRTVLIAADGIGSYGGGSVACREFLRGAQRALEQGGELELARAAGALRIEAAYRAHEDKLRLEAHSVLCEGPEPDPENRGEIPSPEMGLCYLGFDIRSDRYRVHRHGDCKAAHYRFDRRSRQMTVITEILADGAAQEAIWAGSLLPENLYDFPERNVAYSPLALDEGCLRREPAGEDDPELEIKPSVSMSDWIAIEPGDWLVIGTDGLWNRFALSAEAVGRELAHAHDPVSAWERFNEILKRLTVEKPHRDDDTTMIFYRHRAGEAAAAERTWGIGLPFSELLSRFRWR